MKATGIVRKVDELGRVVIPIELRRTLGINEGDPLEIFTDDDGQIILRKYAPGCIFCGRVEGVREFSGQLVCTECAVALARRVG
ncbi:MAG: AbrB/MazE/SpoVT family DNA-binding domain-containing protein [Bacillota bacterium]|nr:AbrB/MazE/SpoVT family DNA-binding domain-containing protein [Bacillota bacterium]